MTEPIKIPYRPDTETEAFMLNCQSQAFIDQLPYEQKRLIETSNTALMNELLQIRTMLEELTEAVKGQRQKGEVDNA